MPLVRGPYRCSLIALAVTVAACTPAKSRPPRSGLDDDGDDDGAAVVDAADAASDVGAPVPACPEVAVTRARTGRRVDVQVAFTLEGKPLVFGEPNTLSDGGRLTPTNLRLYLSEAALRTSAGGKVPVDLLDGAGQASRYGVVLLSAEDPDSLKLGMMAPAGTYAGLSFLFGMNDVCNGTEPTQRKPPLTDASQMTWPHLSGYLFLRFESRSSPISRTPLVHMGGFIGRIFAPEVTAPGTVTINGTGTPAITLRVALDEIMKGAGAPADLKEYIGPMDPEALAGEALRQNAARFPIFSIGSGP